MNVFENDSISVMNVLQDDLVIVINVIEDDSVNVMNVFEDGERRHTSNRTPKQQMVTWITAQWKGDYQVAATVTATHRNYFDLIEELRQIDERGHEF
jgi:hypothetical protein